MDNETRISSYGSHKYPFADVVLALFRKDLTDTITSLDTLHDALAVLNADAPVVNVHTDQASIFHKTFYSHMEEEFLPLYNRFIKEVVRPLFGEPIVYQTVPTFRVGLPNNLAVGEFHRDSDYNHAKEALNIWLPVTKAFDTNTVWVESVPGKEDYQPQTLSVGEFLLFSGVLLKHGNKMNVTGKTRVSFDARIIRKREYAESEKSTMTQQRRLVIGEYFSVCE